MTLKQIDYDHVFKILLIGNSGVGKSSLLMRYADDIFSQSFFSTLGVDFKIRTIQSDCEIVKVQMWDTAGQEKFQHIISSYYRGAHGILLVFDITNIKSFTDMQHWVNEAENYSPSSTVKILVGNKFDMKHERSVTYEEAAEYAEKLGVTYIETSAKDDINIEESFTHLIIHMKKQLPPKKCPLIKESQKKITCC